jgi:hypothetical protein
MLAFWHRRLRQLDIEWAEVSKCCIRRHPTVRIIVADNQAQELRHGRDGVEIVDQQGKVIGRYFPAFTPAEIAEAKRRSATETGGRTTAEVLARLA